MIVVRFPDSQSEKKALGFLARRFSIRTRDDGTTLVPEAAVQVMNGAGILFVVEGQASYDQQIPKVRNPPAAAIQ